MSSKEGWEVIRLKKSEVWNRKMRQDDTAELDIPTRTLALKAAEAGKMEAAGELLEYGHFEGKKMHDASVSLVDDALTYMADLLGEEEIARFWRKSFYPRVKARLALNLTPEEQIQRFAEDHRGHSSDMEIFEDADRYVLKLKECGSGSVLMKTRPNVGATKSAHPWSWGRSGIPYYCTHCCIGWEIIATELQGHPALIHDCPHSANEPCVNFFYKKPQAIPDEYFARIGLKKKNSLRTAADTGQ
jgi:hypothetical protein